MSKTLKYILFGIVILAILGLLGYLAFSQKSPGSLIAGIAGIWAAIKSKVFNTKSLGEEIVEVEQEHALKRDEWNRVKEEYDSQFKVFKARMDYFDLKSAKISEQINDLDEEEVKKLEEIKNMSREEKLKLFENLINT
ncbi:MAG: hypothetical protein K8R86_10515 [Bacteroidales bacterium]|nr:hypothetical protein [Bacteroidales bacterium]